MSGVFISYRRADSTAYSGRLYDRLISRFGKEGVFVDADNIKPGDDFIKILESTLVACKALVVVIGPTWVSARDDQNNQRLFAHNDYVRQEIEVALRRNISIYPVLVSNAPMPQAAELPDSIKDLARRQAIVISDHYFEDGVSRLMGSLNQVVAVPPKPLFLRREVSVLALIIILAVGAFVAWRLSHSAAGPVDPALIGSWKGGGSFDGVGRGCCQEWLTIQADGTASIQGSYESSGKCVPRFEGSQDMSCSVNSSGQLVTEVFFLANELGNYAYNMLTGEIPNFRGGTGTTQVVFLWSRIGPPADGLAGKWETTYHIAGMPWHLAMKVNSDSRFTISGKTVIPCTITAKDKVFHLLTTGNQKAYDGEYQIESSQLFRTPTKNTTWMRVSAPSE